jgi:asparagine synthase (glutamine-hydrolysing)
MDQPTIDGVNTWFASKAAAENGYKVVLSGVGGDELFYGYSLVRKIARDTWRDRAIAGIPGARGLIANVVGNLSSRRLHPKLAGLPEFMGSLEGEYYLRRGLFLPQELPTLMDPDLARIGLERLGDFPPRPGNIDSLNAEGVVCILDSSIYLRNQLLRDSDWTSMAHSLELRTPLADATLLDALAPIHAHFRHGAGKQMLAKAPANPLPDSIIRRPKTGFGVPMSQWLAGAASRVGWKLPAALATPGTPWTRRWASLVMDSFLGSRSLPDQPSMAVQAYQLETKAL